MILFNNPSTSTEITALFLSLIFLCFIISCFLNPTVFLHNRKKTSIAGLLFCIISATDFIICLVWPIIVLYYAATIDLDTMNCVESESVPKQPQNCYADATPTNLATITVAVISTSVVFLTTAVLAIVRSIQIKYPFYLMKKSQVLSVLFVLFATQFIFGAFNILSPLSDKMFFPAYLTAMAVNPYGFASDFAKPQQTSTFISCLSLGIVQLVAIVASAVAAITLFQQRNSVGSSNHTRSRTVGSIKVLLTNLPSLFFGLTFGTPIFFLVVPEGTTDGGILTEREGWNPFFSAVMFPLLSSVWNPIIFVSCTPKTRKTLRSLFAMLKRNPGVGPELGVT